MQYCYAHDNDGAGVLLSSFSGQSQPVTGNVVRFNILQNNGRTNEGEIATYFVEDTNVFYNNTCYTRTNPSNGRVATNATLACVSIGGFGYDSLPIPQFYNNVFVADDTARLLYINAAVPSAPAFQNNAYWSTTNSFSIQWNGTIYSGLNAFRSGAGQEMHAGSPVGISADPQFRSVGTGGTVANNSRLPFAITAYDLASSSPLRGIALDLAANFGIAIGAIDCHRQALPAPASLAIGACQNR